VPENRRRKCLFKTSCSQYIYRKTKERGLREGLRAFYFRMQNCNSNYQIIEVDGEKILVTKTSKLFREKDLNEFILKK
jgi:hypothetical protein